MSTLLKQIFDLPRFYREGIFEAFTWLFTLSFVVFFGIEYGYIYTFHISNEINIFVGFIFLFIGFIVDSFVR